MTTPQPPPQQPVPQQPDAGQDIALVTAISELLLTAASVAVMMAALKLRFKLSAELWQGIAGAAGVAMQQPPPVTGVVGAASAQTSRQNLIRRAQFVLSAGRRLAQDIVQARAQGTPVTQAMADGLARERRYYSAHTAAIWNRAVAAGKTDMAAMEHGPLLGWLSIKDSRTSPECAAASGKNYYASRMPDIGFPGSVHPACRCMAVAPWPGGSLLPSRGARYARAA